MFTAIDLAHRACEFLGLGPEWCYNCAHRDSSKAWNAFWELLRFIGVDLEKVARIAMERGPNSPEKPGVSVLAKEIWKSGRYKVFVHEGRVVDTHCVLIVSDILEAIRFSMRN